MEKVTGIGGVFFKCENTEKVKEWYGKHLGIPISPWGAMFKWREHDEPEKEGTTTWAPFKKDSNHFGSPQQQCMINYRVKDLKALLAELKKEGVQQVGDVQEFEYGKFAWVLDCEGNKIELWEPIDSAFLNEKK
ncbi:MAG: VOC family protein [Flavobacteriales bacterium]